VIIFRIIIIFLFLSGLVSATSFSREKTRYFNALRIWHKAQAVKKQHGNSDLVLEYNKILQKAQFKFGLLCLRYPHNASYKLQLLKIILERDQSALSRASTGRLIAFIEKNSSKEEKSELYYYLGTAQKYYLGNNEKALIWFEKAENFSEETDYPVLYEIAEIYFFQQNYDKALNYFRHIYSNINYLENQAVRERTVFYLAEISFNSRRDEEAVSFYRQVADSMYLNKEELLKVNSLLANNFFWKARFDTASKYYRMVSTLSASDESLLGFLECEYLCGRSIREYTGGKTEDELPHPLIQAMSAEQDGNRYYALVRFEKILAVDPGRFSALYGMLRICRAAGSRARAENYGEKLIAAFLGNGNTEQALALLTELTAENYSIDRFLSGQVLAEAGEHPKAYDCFSRYIDSRKYDEKSLLHIAFYYNQQKMFDEALKVFQILHGLFPARSDILYFLAAGYSEKHDYREAVKYLQKARQADPENPSVLFQLAAALEKSGNFSQAENYFYETIKIDPLHALACNYIAYLYIEKNTNYAEAERLLETALKLDPENPAYLDSAAWLFYKNRDFQKAADYIKKTIFFHEKEKEQDALIYDHAGDIFFLLPDAEKAVLYWQKSRLWEKDQEKIKLLDKKILNAQTGKSSE